MTFHDSVAAYRRQLIEDALNRNQGNRTHTANALGLQRTYLLRLIREMNIRIPSQGPFPRQKREAPSGG